MGTRSRWAVPFVLLGAVIPAVPTSVSGPAPGGQKSWRILFVRYREVTEEPPVAVPDTWIAKGDGSGQRMLIKDAQRPTWSPDRKQIAFFRGGNLWRANADGTEQEQLTTRRTPDNDG